MAGDSRINALLRIALAKPYGLRGKRRKAEMYANWQNSSVVVHFTVRTLRTNLR